MQDLPDWSRALGVPLLVSRIRVTPADFFVSEILCIEFSGDGEHDWLWIEKTGANTHWVAERLACHAGISPRDVGYAGLKDRHAITRQWFSVRRASTAGCDWDAFDAYGVRVLEQYRHQRKLRRGAHQGNSFRIVLRTDAKLAAESELTQRLRSIESKGVPNYFGEQRFGRQAGNLDMARRLFNGRRLSRNKRSIALSAARSYVFNAILDRRVRDATWDRVRPGDLVNLDGSGSVFSADTVDAELEKRCAALDVHPTATLWGRGAPLTNQGVAEMERQVAHKHPAFCIGLEDAGVTARSRPLRMRVRNLQWEFDDDGLRLEFALDRGSYATAVLRELSILELAEQDVHSASAAVDLAG